MTRANVRNAGGAGLIFCAAFAVYVITLAPGVTWGDSAKLASHSIHPRLDVDAGLHPLRAFLACPFNLLPIKDIAFRQNLSSAFSGALGCGFLFLLVRNLTGLRSAALVASGGLALSHIHWHVSVITESYALFSAMLLSSLLCLERALHSGRALWWFTAWLLLALGTYNNLLNFVFGAGIIGGINPAVRRTFSRGPMNATGKREKHEPPKEQEHPLSILFISNADSAHCRRWAQAMAQRGHSVEILSPSGASIPGVEVTVLPFYPTGRQGLSRVLGGWKNTRRLKRFLRERSRDVVHLLGLFPLLSYDLCRVVDDIANLVVSTWGTDVAPDQWSPSIRRGEAVRRHLLKQGRVITATCRYLAECTRQWTEPDRDLRVISYGVDTHAFDPSLHQVARTDEPVLGFLKGLTPRYGPDLFLRAAAAVHAKGKPVRARLAGAGPEEDSLKQLARELGILERTEFLGPLPHEKVPEFLAGIDVFVMPSRFEVFGVSALEASAMERPVVATRVGGVAEAVCEGETGRLVPPEKVEGLVEATLELLRTPAGEAMGKRGRAWVKEHFLWEDNCLQMEQVYRQVASG